MLYFSLEIIKFHLRVQQMLNKVGWYVFVDRKTIEFAVSVFIDR